MRASTVTAIGVIIASALVTARSIPAHLKREDDHTDEVVAMVQCKRMQKGDNTPYGTKDQMWWAKDWDAFFEEPRNPEHEAAYVNAPWQGVPTYLNWTAGTTEEPITGRLRGQTFKLFQQAKTGDPKTNVTGTASYAGNDFTCYGHKSYTTLYEDVIEGVQYVCTPKYACSRTDRMIARTTVRVSQGVFNVTVDNTSTRKPAGSTGGTPIEEIKRIGRKWAEKLYGNLTDAESGGPDAGKAYKMGDSKHSIYFNVMRAENKGDPHWDPERVPTIAREITAMLAPALAEDMQRQCKTWMDTTECEWKMGFPSQVTVMYQLAPQRTGQWMNQDTFTIMVEPDEEEDDCSVFAGIFTIVAGALSGMKPDPAKYGAAIATISAGAACFF